MRAIPPITSRSPIETASSAGNPTLAKKPVVPTMSETLGKPRTINAIPASILMGRGPKLVKL
jgi:hypothetical protein